jgi:nucleotide-binding universal stress UspA family protein
VKWVLPFPAASGQTDDISGPIAAFRLDNGNFCEFRTTHESTPFCRRAAGGWSRRRLSKAAAPWQHAAVWRSTGTCMTTQRRSYETGHKPKCLVIVDETAEWDRAVYYASRWAIRVGGGVVMLRIIEIEDQNQQWLGVADIMRAEAEEAANEALDRASGRANGIAAITPERVIREGEPTAQILDVIDKDVDISMLVLAANPGPEGPGPLVSMMAQVTGSFPIPVVIVPGDLSDTDIDALS